MPAIRPSEAVVQFCDSWFMLEESSNLGAMEVQLDLEGLVSGERAPLLQRIADLETRLQKAVDHLTDSSCSCVHHVHSEGQGCKVLRELRGSLY